MAVTVDTEAGARWAPAFRALGDERLAKLVESGSDPAFAAIYGRYAGHLQGYCRSLLHDEEEAGDAMQTAMLKALQAMRRSARTGPLRPWLFRIAHNESVTILRQRSRRPGPLDEQVVAGQGDAHRTAAAREELAELLRDLEELTDYQRGALVMRELGGLSYDEIGDALSTSPLAARQAVFTAKRRLTAGPDGARTRPSRRLRLLIPPVPAGAALLTGALGGAAGGGATAAKTLVAAVAAAGIGFGSVEVVREVPKPADKPRAEAARSAPESREQVDPVVADAVATAKADGEAVAVAAVTAPAQAKRSTQRRYLVSTTPAATRQATRDDDDAGARAERPQRRDRDDAPAHHDDSADYDSDDSEPVSAPTHPSRGSHPARGTESRTRGDCPAHSSSEQPAATPAATPEPVVEVPAAAESAADDGSVQ